MEPTLYLDMDGVVADWETAVADILGYKLVEGDRWPDQDWRKIIQFQRIYRDLPLLPWALDFVDQACEIAVQAHYAVRFLTAVPRRNDFPWAFEDKVHWANRHWPTIPVWFGPYSQDKQKRAAPGQILVDDRMVNITEWTAQGGRGIHFHRNPDSVLTELRGILLHDQ
jgi:hypothetical protein